MKFFDSKSMLIKVIVFFSIAIIGVALFVTLGMRGKDDLKFEKVILSFEQDNVFSLDPYIDCLYEVNKDKANRCIEIEVESLIDNGKASEVLQLIRVMDENEENIVTNCEYIAERIGKVFKNITDIESLLRLDFSYCDYGFQIGVIGEIDESTLNDNKFLTVVKKACSGYITEANPKVSGSGECHRSIANILTGSASKVGPLESRDFCLAIGDPEGVCLSNLLKNYLDGVSSNKLSKGLFTDKENVVETLIGFCKSGAVDKTKICLTDTIANIFFNNEKLVYLIADYCGKVKLEIRKSCYREIAGGFNIAIKSAFNKDNQESINNKVDPTKIFNIFIDNSPNYCNFLDEVVGLNKEYVDQCYIGLALVLLDYYEMDEAKVCKYFRKKEYHLCKVGIKINNSKAIDAKYRVE